MPLAAGTLLDQQFRGTPLPGGNQARFFPLPLQPGDLLRMEAIVLDCLSFRVNTPTAHTFLSMYKQALGLQPRTCALASYLAVSFLSALICQHPCCVLPQYDAAAQAVLGLQRACMWGGPRRDLCRVFWRVLQSPFPVLALLPNSRAGNPPNTCSECAPVQELALLEYDVQAFRPSQVASAATLMAQLYLGDTESLRCAQPLHFQPLLRLPSGTGHTSSGPALVPFWPRLVCCPLWKPPAAFPTCPLTLVGLTSAPLRTAATCRRWRAAAWTSCAPACAGCWRCSKGRTRRGTTPRHTCQVGPSAMLGIVMCVAQMAKRDTSSSPPEAFALGPPLPADPRCRWCAVVQCATSTAGRSGSVWPAPRRTHRQQRWCRHSSQRAATAAAAAHKVRPAAAVSLSNS